MDTYDLIVVGSGPAGEKAAALAAYFGKRVAAVERDGRPGGPRSTEAASPRRPSARRPCI
jgi:NAD(P) transhydrogenase